MKKPIGKYNDENLYLQIASYQNNRRIYLAVETEDELYADITINLSDMLIPDDDYIFVNSDMTTELRNFLEKKKIIGDTIETYQYNMGRYDMAKVDFNLLKEYDPEGFEEFEKYQKKDIELWYNWFVEVKRWEKKCCPKRKGNM